MRLKIRYLSDGDKQQLTCSILFLFSWQSCEYYETGITIERNFACEYKLKLQTEHKEIKINKSFAKKLL